VRALVSSVQRDALATLTLRYVPLVWTGAAPMPLPQQYSACVVVTPHVTVLPAEMLVKASGVVEPAGGCTALLGALKIAGDAAKPSWPASLRPQQNAAAVPRSTAHTWLTPTETLVKLRPPATARGRVLQL
jgi:hypothetical protein